nr:FUSC family protein [Ancylobacter lacus]
MFSGKAFFAAMLALYIALAFDLPRTYWAVTAVYIVSSPLAGATSSKALYRALGTVMGAVAAVVLVPLLIDAPELLVLAVALWTGGLLYISLLDRTPRSYVFMLAGYSLALIALPDVGAPESIFDTALARSEEILLGISCAALVGTMVFPSSLGPSLSGRLALLIEDAASWADEILRGEGALPATPLRRQRLATDIAGLDLVISQLAYDVGARDIARHARELRGRLLMLLPLFSSLADRLYALKTSGRLLAPELAATLQEVAEWIGHGARCDAGEGPRLLARIQALEPGGRTDWEALVLSSGLERLRDIVELWQDCVSLQRLIAEGKGASHWRPVFVSRRILPLSRHHDHGLLLFSAASVALSVVAASAVWIGTGWASGAGFVMMAAVAGSFFAGLDQPVPKIRSMLVLTVVAILIAALYLFIILPLVQSFEMLVLVLAPAFLALGLMITRPALAMSGVLVAVNVASFVALQNRYSAEFAGFANDGLASAAGIGFALAWAAITRPFGSAWAARRLVHAGWADLAETAAGERRADSDRLAGRSLDRLGQLVPRLGSLEDRVLADVDGFAEVRVGFNVVELQRTRAAIGPAGGLADAVLDAVSGLYAARQARGTVVAPPETLRIAIDRALGGTLDTSPAGRRAIDALVGLRRVFFPEAAPPLSTRAAPALPLAAE